MQDNLVNARRTIGDYIGEPPESLTTLQPLSSKELDINFPLFRGGGVRALLRRTNPGRQAGLISQIDRLRR